MSSGKLTLPIGISAIADLYDLYFVDLFGVIHDGIALYPGAREVISKLTAMQKTVIFVSNAPRRSFKSQETLTKLGITPNLYKGIVTAGDVAFDYLKQNQIHKDHSTGYFYIGPDRDRELLADLKLYQETSAVEEAAFLLVTGYFNNDYNIEPIMPLLKRALKYNIPLLCANPDLEIVRQNGKHEPCAGVIARLYSKAGGTVKYFGKPYKEIYQLASQVIGIATNQMQRILAIGDGLETDIKGANEFGIDSLFITDGIFKAQVTDQNSQKLNLDKLNSCSAEFLAYPTFAMPQLIW